jgi:hypothetical protein
MFVLPCGAFRSVVAAWDFTLYRARAITAGVDTNFRMHQRSKPSIFHDRKQKKLQFFTILKKLNFDIPMSEFMFSSYSSCRLSTKNVIKLSVYVTEYRLLLLKVLLSLKYR